MNKLPLYEKVGYAMGDAAANLVWRGALAYLAVFYTDTFGLAASAAAILFLVVRLTDGMTDIIMGMIADRTQTSWGKFRPWILWSTPFLGAFMVLCFTTPNLSDTGKLLYAYLTYIGLTLAYTVNNVPYSALMGVMTDDDKERTSLSGFRFAGAFVGGLFVMGFLPALVGLFGDGNDAKGYQYTMYVFAGLLMALMVTSVATTKERVVPIVQTRNSLRSELWDLTKQSPFVLLPLLSMTLFFYYRNVISGLFFVLVFAVATWFVRRMLNRPQGDKSGTQLDMLDLLTNKPWLILLGMGFLTMMYNGIKYSVIAYYFKYFVGDELLTGQYFIALLVVSILGALCTSYLARKLGRRNLFIVALLLSSVLTCGFYWLPGESVSYIFVLGCAAEFFAAMMPTLFFSMLGDAADYSEWRNGRRATGLVYSAGTFVQKTGNGFAGALVLVVLAGYGYDGMDATTIEASLPGMQQLMSFIPAAFGLAGALLMLFYPLTEKRQQQMNAELIARRSAIQTHHQ
ncbi:MAG: MFS transporter [Paraglaciecola chathamensis]|uniref:Sugar:cation symporter family protein n=1 Tax=Paraglaciecola agarilytica NO2 TaxID=1125747 RepID=A0ABQ0IBG8_9ALTE|nr:MFS transporter [Paraglaciecola agarilytica]GAC06743.1 sugar:cation symporter family protein [Paraglaciecola agarilytica NO2]